MQVCEANLATHLWQEAISRIPPMQNYAINTKWNKYILELPNKDGKTSDVILDTMTTMCVRLNTECLHSSQNS